jgi:hypothetical protein
MVVQAILGGKGWLEGSPEGWRLRAGETPAHAKAPQGAKTMRRFLSFRAGDRARTGDPQLGKHETGVSRRQEPA